MNENLHINYSNEEIKIKVMQYNIYFKYKEDRVIKLINDVNADIVCLQEVAQIPGTKSINKFLSNFDQYYYELAYRDAKEGSFGQAILYKKDKFYPLKTVKQWISDTSNMVSNTYDTGNLTYLLFGTQFMHISNNKIVTNKAPFWIFNTHFGIPEDTKTKSAHKTVQLIKSLVEYDEYLLCGDFNFFPDKDADKQRKIFTDEMIDFGKGAKTLSGLNIEGTFIGMHYDPYHININNHSSINSRLDHIFGSTGFSSLNPTLYSKTMLDIEPKDMMVSDFPSDHLPLVIDFRLKN